MKNILDTIYGFTGENKTAADDMPGKTTFKARTIFHTKGQPPFIAHFRLLDERGNTANPLNVAWSIDIDNEYFALAYDTAGNFLLTDDGYVALELTDKGREIVAGLEPGENLYDNATLIVEEHIYYMQIVFDRANVFPFLWEDTGLEIDRSLVVEWQTKPDSKGNRVTKISKGTINLEGLYSGGTCKRPFVSHDQIAQGTFIMEQRPVPLTANNNGYFSEPQQYMHHGAIPLFAIAQPAGA